MTYSKIVLKYKKTIIYFKLFYFNYTNQFVTKFDLFKRLKKAYPIDIDKKIETKTALKLIFNI